MNKLCTKILALLILAVVFCQCSNDGSNSKLPNESFLIHSSYLSNQMITSILEDSLGYIWIGTERGLNRYDGYEYYQYFYNEEESYSLCNNSIQCLFTDNKSNLWIGTKEGICTYDRDKEQFNNVIVENKYKIVLQIIQSSKGIVYANLGDAVYEYNETKNSFIQLIEFDENSNQNRCFVDEQNHLWLVSRFSIKCYGENDYKLVKKFESERVPNLVYSDLLDGVNLWTMHGKAGVKLYNTRLMEEQEIPETLRKHPVLSKALITQVFRYSESQLLFVTHKNGLFLFDQKQNKIFSQDDYEFLFEVLDCNITCLFKDSRDNLWIGSHEKGFHIIYKYENQFNYNRHLQALAKGNSIKTVTPDQNNNIWMSTYDDDLYNYNLETKEIETKIDLTTFFTEDPFFQDKILDLIIDGENVWFISMGKILHCVIKNKVLIREKTYTTSSIVCQLTLDQNHKLWVSSENELVYLVDKNLGKMVEVPVFDRGIICKSSILALSDGRIMVAASKQPIKIIDPERNNKITTLNNLISTTNFEPTTLYEDSKNNVWIGQMNGPLMKYVPETNLIEETEIDNATSIIEDDKNEIWIGTSYGLCHYNPVTGKQFTYYSYDGTGGNQFNTKCVAMLPDSSLVFGGTHGLTTFKPSAISINREIPLFIESLEINNDYSYKIANNNTSEPKQIKLKHNENNFSILYTALDISENSRLRFYYKLDRYNTDWVDAKNNREAYYSNLRPGTYNFRVKITSNDNAATESETSLLLTITRPPWYSWLSIFLYAVVVSYLIWLFVNLYYRLKQNKAKAFLAQQEKEQEALINQMQMSFFSNVSHEFRTPLSIIRGPINLLAKSEHLPAQEKSLVALVQRSANRMLRLVNQLLDISKIESDAINLKTERTDITHQVKTVMASYKFAAREKNIQLEYEGLNEDLFMFVDIDKLEKIFANVLSNAIKFTPEGGQITIRLNIIKSQDAKTLFPDLSESYDYYFALFEVTDTGIGIPEDKLELIFQRYYQIDDQNNTRINWGTGIGLYYTRRLLQLHHGEIKANNRPEGGSRFTFVIPTHETAYSENERITSAAPRTEIESKIQDNSTDSPEISDDRKTILVVDDDIDIAYFLKSILSPAYNVIIKYDGLSALEELEKTVPNLIVSDVLMPGMNGYQLCSKVKEDINFCHIPVILLTAKTLLEEQVEGLELGANAYVTKPFELEYLLALVKSQLKNQSLLSQLLNKGTNTKEIKEEILSPKDKIFMEQLFELLENELSNSDANITAMAEKMNLSRTTFSQKIKALTGQKPNVFFMKYKLNRAAEILLTGKYNISEVADMTGFATLSHFSVSFKKQFNCNPSEYNGI
ncbi:MAG: two-component regulator propeller domain-containing protein [Draconibacterium sp.]